MYVSYLLVSSSSLLRFSLWHGCLSARGIGDGMGTDICMYAWRVGIPTSESIKVKRLNWIFVSQGTRRCGRQIQLQLRLRLRLQAKATASVWILWLNYQRMMFWWFHLHISAIRQEQEEEQGEHEAGGEQQQGWRHCVNIVPQPKFMYNTCPTSRRVHKDAETQMEMATKPESNSLPACRWEVSILIEAINTLNEFPAVSSTMDAVVRWRGCTQRILLVLPVVHHCVAFSHPSRCRLRLSTLRLLGLSLGLDQGAGLARSPVPSPESLVSYSCSPVPALLCVLSANNSNSRCDRRRRRRRRPKCH